MIQAIEEGDVRLVTTWFVEALQSVRLSSMEQRELVSMPIALHVNCRTS